MVLVRVVFQCKAGTAGEVVKILGDSTTRIAEALGARRITFLTDLSGPLDQVIEHVELESLAEWEASREKIFAHPEFHKSRDLIGDMIVSGSMEFYTIEYSS